MARKKTPTKTPSPSVPKGKKKKSTPVASVATNPELPSAVAIKPRRSPRHSNPIPGKVDRPVHPATVTQLTPAFDAVASQDHATPAPDPEPDVKERNKEEKRDPNLEEKSDLAGAPAPDPANPVVAPDEEHVKFSKTTEPDPDLAATEEESAAAHDLADFEADQAAASVPAPNHADTDPAEQEPEMDVDHEENDPITILLPVLRDNLVSTFRLVLPEATFATRMFFYDQERNRDSEWFTVS